MHPLTAITPRIGIFWVYRHIVIGQAIDLFTGEEGVPGLLDSPATHADLWERSRNRLAGIFDSQKKEYDQIPRGRVLWTKQTNQPIVYLDSWLFNSTDMSQIADFFTLSGVPVVWRTDSHYTTFGHNSTNIFEQAPQKNQKKIYL